MKLLKWNLLIAVSLTIFSIGASGLDSSFIATERTDLVNHPIETDFYRIQGEIVASVHRALPTIGRSPLLSSQNTKNEFGQDILTAKKLSAREKGALLRKRLDQFSKAVRDEQVDVRGCAPIKQTTGSCYGGEGDGFRGGPIEQGLAKLSGTDMSVAYPDLRYRNAILVFRNPANGRARKAVVTDWGPAEKIQRRGVGVDLNMFLQKQLGIRCANVPIQIFNCAARDHNDGRTESALNESGGRFGVVQSAHRARAAR